MRPETAEALPDQNRLPQLHDRRHSRLEEHGGWRCREIWPRPEWRPASLRFRRRSRRIRCRRRGRVVAAKFGKSFQHPVRIRRSSDDVRGSVERGAGARIDRRRSLRGAFQTADRNHHLAPSLRSHRRSSHGGRRRTDDYLAQGQRAIFPRTRRSQGHASSRRSRQASHATQVQGSGESTPC